MSTLDMNQSLNLKGSPNKRGKNAMLGAIERNQMMNSYIMSQMDIPGRMPHKQIKPESLTFNNEVKITRTKTDGLKAEGDGDPRPLFQEDNEMQNEENSDNS